MLLLFPLAACGTPTDTDATDSPLLDSAPPPCETTSLAADTAAPAGLSTSGNASGDLSCVGQDLPLPPASAQVDQAVTGTVLDLQTGTPVARAEVDVSYADTVSATPDVVATADASGAYSATVRACTPYARTTLAGGDSLPTYAVHRADAPGEAEEAWSVATETPTVVAALVGTSWDEDTGFIFGSVLDCGGGPVGAVQVYLHDDAGTAAPSELVYYFDHASLPAPRHDAPEVDADNGLFVVVGLPEGTWTAEVWGSTGAGLVRLAAAPVESVGGAVTEVDLVAGRADGVQYAASCTASCD